MRKSSGTHPPRVASLAPDVPHSDAAGIRIACGRTPYATLDARAPQDTPSAAAHIVFQNQRDAWIAERRARGAHAPRGTAGVHRHPGRIGSPGVFRGGAEYGTRGACAPKARCPAFSAPFPNSILMKDGIIAWDDLITCEIENRRRFPRAGLRLFAMQSLGRTRPAISRAGNGGGG